tara:strand:+ start:2412 stop:2702 length:291 start_codon:yes stop_codon:yes gene_type:complete
MSEEKQGLDLGTFITFIFSLIGNARDEAGDPQLDSKIRNTIITLSVVLISAAEEIGVLTDDAADIVGDDPVKTLFRDIYRTYEAMRTMDSDAPASD